MRSDRVLAAAALLALGACGEEMEDERWPATEEEPAAEAEPAVRTEMLVSTGWLAQHAGGDDVLILHVAPDRSGYDEGHIPGARFLPVSAFAHEADGIANELPEVEHLDSVFESVGLSDDTRVVVYGPALPAARAFFTLDYLGHGGRTALLDGGVEAWRAEGRPLSTEAPPAERGSFTPRPQDIVVDATWVRQNLGNTDVAVIDARPEAEFTGEVAGDGVPRPGHIPGAANVFWQRTIEAADDPTLRDPRALRNLYEHAGATPGTTVVTYCRTGMQASFAYFVARYLGYDARMYDGSYMDWSRRSELPVE